MTALTHSLLDWRARVVPISHPTSIQAVMQTSIVCDSNGTLLDHTSACATTDGARRRIHYYEDGSLWLLRALSLSRNTRTAAVQQPGEGTRAFSPDWQALVLIEHPSVSLAWPAHMPSPKVEKSSTPWPTTYYSVCTTPRDSGN